MEALIIIVLFYFILFSHNNSILSPAMSNNPEIERYIYPSWAGNLVAKGTTLANKRNDTKSEENLTVVDHQSSIFTQMLHQ